MSNTEGGLQACKTLLIKELALEMSVFILPVAYLLNMHQEEGERRRRGGGGGGGGEGGGGGWLTVLQPYFLSRLSAM